MRICSPIRKSVMAGRVVKKDRLVPDPFQLKSRATDDLMTHESSARVNSAGSVPLAWRMWLCERNTEYFHGERYRIFKKRQSPGPITFTSHIQYNLIYTVRGMWMCGDLESILYIVQLQKRQTIAVGGKGRSTEEWRNRSTEERWIN